MKRLLVLFVMVVMVATFALASGSSESQEAAASGEVEDPVELALELADRATRGANANYQGTSDETVAVVMPQLDNEGFRAMYIGSLSAGIEQNASVVTLDARNDVDTQLAMIEDMITQQVDAIVFVPVDSAAMSTGVVRANDAGIPIVAMDRSTQGGELTALVESNNVAIGRGGADLMVQAAENLDVPVEELRVLELLGDMATSAAVERHEGFSEAAGEYGITIVQEGATNWDPAQANAAVLDAFQANPDINAIYMASGCAMYTGVRSALETIGRLHTRNEEGHVILISSDGCPAPMDGIREGYVDGDSAHQMLRIGRTAVDVAIDAAQGNPPSQEVFRMDPDLITPENVESLDHWANNLSVE